MEETMPPPISSSTRVALEAPPHCTEDADSAAGGGGGDREVRAQEPPATLGRVSGLLCGENGGGAGSENGDRCKARLLTEVAVIATPSPSPECPSLPCPAPLFPAVLSHCCTPSLLPAASSRPAPWPAKSPQPASPSDLPSPSPLTVPARHCGCQLRRRSDFGVYISARGSKTGSAGARNVHAV